MIRAFIIFGGVLIFLAVIMSGATNWLKLQPAEALQYESKFEVVDRYQNRCDVIQYIPDNSARYSYFLDCK